MRVENHLQRYTTIETLLDVQDLQVRMTRIADFEALLEYLDPITFTEDERLPYWAELWPAAVAMAQYIAEKRKCDGGWDNLTVRLRWEEFAARPKVRPCLVASLHSVITFPME